ncbi:radial spoke head 14 homolog [Symphorus nematophorus]
MTGRVLLPDRAPVAFGLRAVPQLFEHLQPLTEVRPSQLQGHRVLLLGYFTSGVSNLWLGDHTRPFSCSPAAPCGFGFLEQLKVLLKDEHPAVRAKTCELLHKLTAHCIGRQAVLSSSFLPHLSQLLDDPFSSCRRNVHRVLNHLTVLPSGPNALLSLVPKLMLKLMEGEEEEEELQVLLISTISSCSRLDPLPALAADGVSLLGLKMAHRSPNVRREAAAAMMALSVCEDGMRRVCEEGVLPLLVALLQDEDVEVQANAAGVIMYAVVITTGKRLCLDLDVVPVLLDLVSKKEEEAEERDQERRRRRKALVMNSLRALTALAEAPDGRRLLLEQLPLLEARSGAAEEDKDIRRAAQTTIRVVTWLP